MANAGRVAIVPKGDYSSSTAYNRLDLVRYNEKAYVAKKGNTGVAPTNTEYWMLMTSDGITIDTALSDTSTNPVQNKVIKTAIDNIQTTSRATLSTAGWYRVAEYRGGSLSGALGASANTCDLSIKRNFGNTPEEYHLVRFKPMYKASNNYSTEFVSLGGTSATQAITKVRHVVDTNNNYISYLEIYYSVNVNNGTFFGVSQAEDMNRAWKAITPTLTSETVDGVTVTTTYDIPANASPVTDLDLVQFNGTETLTTSILEKASTLSIGNYEYRIGGDSYTGSDLPSYWYKFSDATVKVRDASTIEVTVWGVNLGGSVSVPIVNYYNGSSWSGWQTLATTADLANYLPLSGGIISGIIQQKVSGEYASYRLQNSTGTVDAEFMLNSQLGSGIYDNIAKRWVMITNLEGNSSFNGTASGNLPLTGGQVGEGAWSDSPLEIYGQFGTTKRSLIKYSYTGTLLGYMGFDYDGNPIIIHKSAGQKNLHHDGNSAKVAIQESAPTDTSALWVDTANKVTKAYIDGAWTQVA